MGEPILVAGGGIAGLAVAIGLAQRGYPVEVLERRPVFAEIGAGIQLGPNAFHALDALGVANAVLDHAVRIGELRLMNAVTGAVIVRMPLDAAFRRRFGQTYAVVHRPDLYRPLLEACRQLDAVHLRSDCPVAGYRQTRDGVVAVLESGAEVSGRALIGADGLRSAVRRQLAGDGDPSPAGHTTYRSVIPADHMPRELCWNAAVLWAGPKRHVVHYPIAAWRAFNLVVTSDNGVQEPLAGQPVSAERVRTEFAGLDAAPRQLIEIGRDWRAWSLCDREPLTRWHDGRVGLIGDAAHPVLQYLAQGACLALEDAVVLAELSDGTRDWEQVFTDFTAQRQARTARVQWLSRLIGEQIYHPAGAKARDRDERLAAMTASEIYDQAEWLYGGFVKQEVHR